MRLFFSVLIFTLGVLPAPAGDLARFLEATDQAFMHYRTAVSYLRTENDMLAAIELEQMDEKWSVLRAEFDNNVPDAFDGNPHFKSAVKTVADTIAEALTEIDAGSGQAARESLLPLRETMTRLRRASNLYILADCVGEANAAMNRFIRFRKNPPDWEVPEDRTAVLQEAAIYAFLLDRCDKRAPEAVQSDPEFRRLIDGSRDSLALVPEAVDKKDGGLLYRILIELRSFDNLLFLRFG